MYIDVLLIHFGKTNSPLTEKILFYFLIFVLRIHVIVLSISSCNFTLLHFYKNVFTVSCRNADVFKLKSNNTINVFKAKPIVSTNGFFVFNGRPARST